MMTVCDAHLHYGLRAPVEQILRTSPLREKYPCYRTVQTEAMERYEELLGTHGVECTVLVPFVFREQDSREENAVVLDFAQRDPAHRFPYALLDERDPGFIAEHYRDYVGVKEHIVRNESVLTPEKKLIFEQVRDHGMTFLLHSERVRRVEYVRAVLDNFPGIKIQIAHMGRGMPGDTALICEMLRAFRPYENVTFDTSTIRTPEVIGKAVDIIGAERILYGSDLPFFIESPQEDIIEAQIGQILQADITDAQREQIFSTNFQHWIRRGV